MSEDALRQVLDEAVAGFEALWEAGKAPDIDAYCARFPSEIRAELKTQLEMHSILADISAHAPEVPHRLGVYELREELGRGGMGTVYLAHDADLERQIALKVVRFEPQQGERMSRFLREARVMARIRHPHVVDVYAFGREGDWIYLAMEKMERSLDGQSVPWPQAVAWVREACAGVAACHERGVLHRDLKLANLLLDATGRVKVADFGIANAEDSTRLTRTGQAWGTPGFAAPEQLVGGATDRRTDVYGLGACLYALIAGHPWDGLGRPSASVVVPRWLAGVLDASLAADREDRPADAEALAEILRRAGVALYPTGLPWLVAAVVAASMVAWYVGLPDPRPVVSAPGEPLPGGVLVMYYNRAHAQDPTPPDDQSAAISPSRRWDLVLEEFSRSRDPSAAIERRFDDRGVRWTVRVDPDPDGVALSLSAAEEVRARVVLSGDQLFGSTESWGIFRETADEDGDGYRETVLVRVTDETASIAVIQWDPQAWGSGSGFRIAGAAAKRFALPAFADGALSFVRSGYDAMGFAGDKVVLDADTGAIVHSESLPILPVGPRAPGVPQLYLSPRHRLLLPRAEPQWQWGDSEPGLDRAVRHLDLDGDGTPERIQLRVGGAEPAAWADRQAPTVLADRASVHWPGLWWERERLLCVGGSALTCLGPDGVPRWTVPLPSAAVTPPVLVGSEVAIASERAVYFVRNGSLRRTVQLDGTIVAPLVEHEGRVLASTRDALYAVADAALLIRQATPRTIPRGAPKAVGEHLLLSEEGKGGKRHGLVLIDAAGNKVWGFATPTPVESVAVAERRGRTWLYFADLEGSAWGLPLPAVDESAAARQRR